LSIHNRGNSCTLNLQTTTTGNLGTGTKYHLCINVQGIGTVRIPIVTEDVAMQSDIDTKASIINTGSNTPSFVVDEKLGTFDGIVDHSNVTENTVAIPSNTGNIGDVYYFIPSSANHDANTSFGNQEGFYYVDGVGNNDVVASTKFIGTASRYSIYYNNKTSKFYKFSANSNTMVGIGSPSGSVVIGDDEYRTATTEEIDSLIS